MTENTDVVTPLGTEQSWDRLRTQEVGRLVTRIGDVIDIFPVNYIVDGETLLFRTAEGSKLFELTVNEDVLFEADDHTETDAWSVVVRGTAERLSRSDDVAAADALPLKPWIPTLKYNYVRITPRTLSGRAFVRGEEPDRYGVVSAS